jgi:hypothetical protein
MLTRIPTVVSFGLVVTTGLFGFFAGDALHKTGTESGFKQHDIHRPKPPVVEPLSSQSSTPAPKDAIILFDGSTLNSWRGNQGQAAAWKVADGAMEVVPGAGAIHTKEQFGDVQLHVEWASPNPPAGKGQDRGNSGIFLMGHYELQVLDSYQADTYADGQAGAIYGQFPPLFNASRPPGEWQTYDIAFRRPRFDGAGKLLDPARATLIHNGILVQNNEELLGQTSWLRWLPYEPGADRGPIELQDHGHPVRFRNIWVRNLPERPAPTAQDLKRSEPKTLSDDALNQFTGQYVMGSRQDGARISITRSEGHLLVKFAFLPKPLPILPTSEVVFEMPNTDGSFTFLKDDQGRVKGATFHIGDGERALLKIEK